MHPAPCFHLFHVLLPGQIIPLPPADPSARSISILLHPRTRHLSSRVASCLTQGVKATDQKPAARGRFAHARASVSELKAVLSKGDFHSRQNPRKLRLHLTRVISYSYACSIFSVKGKISCPEAYKYWLVAPYNFLAVVFISMSLDKVIVILLVSQHNSSCRSTTSPLLFCVLLSQINVLFSLHLILQVKWILSAFYCVRTEAGL